MEERNEEAVSNYLWRMCSWLFFKIYIFKIIVNISILKLFKNIKNFNLKFLNFFIKKQVDYFFCLKLIFLCFYIILMC